MPRLEQPGKADAYSSPASLRYVEGLAEGEAGLFSKLPELGSLAQDAKASCRETASPPTRKTNLPAAPATNWPDGQINKSLSSPSRKNISVEPSGKSDV